MQRVLAISGPTASGKSGLAEQMARRFPIELVSVDSAVVYRGMDVGTAKPSAAIRDELHYHLVDIREPQETYSAAEFRSDAIETISHIVKRGRIPCLVGGSMLYYRALKHGIAELPGADESVRSEISAMAERAGWPAVHTELSRVDPKAAARINENDPQRLQRALEVYRITGISLSELQARGNLPCPYELVELALLPDRAVLHTRIADRFKGMLAEGLIEEVEALLERPQVSRELPSMKSVGYRQVAGFLSGEFSRQEMTEKALVATRRLAKHQYTWLNSWQGLHRLGPEYGDESGDGLIDRVLKIEPVASILG